MRFEIDEQYLIRCFQEFVSVPSPVSYSVQLTPVLERYAAAFGRTITYDRRGTAYMELEGEDSSKTVLLSAHCDTLGLMVRTIDSDGKLRVRQLGGINYNNLEGESVTVCARDGRTYSGIITCQSHSVHVFEDARTLERTEKTMVVLLDEDVHSEADIRALGIRHGDLIFIDPHCEVTPNGYIKSRFIDNKASVACVFAMLKVLQEQNLKPKYRTLIAFTFGEEIGMGGPYVPAEVCEYVAVDIGLIGPDYDGHERNVTICAKDKKAPYSYELTNRLIACAEKAGCDYAVDIFFNYSTDATAAILCCNDLQIGAFGMPVYSSHGRERTHVLSLKNTTNLMLAYVLGL